MHTVFLPCLSLKLSSFSFWVSHFWESFFIRWSLTSRLSIAASSNPLLQFAENMDSMLQTHFSTREMKGWWHYTTCIVWCFHPLGRWKKKVLMIQCQFCSCNVLPEGGNLIGTTLLYQQWQEHAHWSAWSFGKSSYELWWLGSLLWALRKLDRGELRKRKSWTKLKPAWIPEKPNKFSLLFFIYWDDFFQNLQLRISDLNTS